MVSISLGLCACELRLNDPFKVEEPADCEVESQNQFVVDVMREFYLWTDELPADIDLSAWETPESLVSDLRQGVDRWTRISDKSTSDALFMEGKFVGLGYKTLRGPDNEVRISFVSDNSPATAVNLLRGDMILGVNGVSAEQLDAEGSWSSVYGDNEPGVEVSLEIERLATGEVETVMLTKDWIDIVSIPVASVVDGPGGVPVGYYIMDKFVETTKSELEATYAMFKEKGVSTVVIDLRYNGGGLISVAERQVNLTVGADHEGATAYTFQYNSNYTSENKSTEISELGHSLGADEVIVLTSSRTLSASELVINALLPYAKVTLIGGPTGGKPVGSKSFEFCDKLLFPITFRLVNANGNTDYFEGMPADCFAEDDLFHQLGDPEEGMLAAALAYLDSGACDIQPMPAPGLPPRLTQLDSVGETLLPNALEREDIDSW
ncbi:putative CtpA-like serine protease [Enhygromyxa salina]|uniref:Putative CtpA-like serine protease n=1 Tax=Enhygromyxa salina TaxID=215803 RepID=A0A2S9YGG4_9BACT|nr:S41 family peptidase [Enhygromyxa salina]PRQ04200.1 putative CtpA-like serine protease [Enhygromyxa salina]